MTLNRHVLLVQPIIEGITQATPDLGLAYLATALRSHGYGVTILDCVRERFTQRDFENYLGARQFLAVGFKLFSLDTHSAQRMMESVRRIQPETTIVLGGPHPSAEPSEVLGEFLHADFAFHGEVQEGLPNLLDCLEAQGENGRTLEGIPGLVFRRGKSTIVNPAQTVDDLDKLGLPAWDLIDPRLYSNCETLWPFPSREAITAPLAVVRGCPFFCTYCAGHTLSRRQVRFRDLGNIMRELEWLYHDFGVREFQIVDDFFTVDRDFVKAFCAELNRRALGMVWCCPAGVRLGSLNRDLVRTMEDAGCYGVGVGIESGSQRVLDFVRKAVTVEEIREKLDMVAAETNWLVVGFFILGFPTETRDEILETIRLAGELPIDGAAFNAFRVHKGTELYEYLLASGELTDDELIHLTGREFGYAPKGLEPQELRRLRRKAYWLFFRRPSRVWTQLRSMTSTSHFRRVVGKIRVKMFN